VPRPASHRDATKGASCEHQATKRKLANTLYTSEFGSAHGILGAHRYVDAQKTDFFCAGRCHCSVRGKCPPGRLPLLGAMSARGHANSSPLFRAVLTFGEIAIPAFEPRRTGR
jgi:hypothetical protein